MSKASTLTETANYIDYVLFEVDDMVCGMDIMTVQEIKKLTTITPAHHAPDYVRGVVNIRGQIVTLIDIQQRLGMAALPYQKSYLTIIVPHHGELTGILVKSVEDIVRATRDEIDALPSNLQGVKRQFIKGILKRDTSLVSIINHEALIEAAHPGSVLPS